MVGWLIEQEHIWLKHQGARQGHAAQRIEKIKAVTDVPVGVGFGISDAASAKVMGAVADAVIVGSAFVKQFANLEPEQAVVETVNKVKELRAALDELV